MKQIILINLLCKDTLRVSIFSPSLVCPGLKGFPEKARANRKPVKWKPCKSLP